MSAVLAPSGADDAESSSSVGTLSRPMSPGGSSIKGGSKRDKGPPKPGAKPKKGRVVIQEDSSAADAAAAHMQRQVNELQQQLHEANVDIAKRTRSQAVLEQQMQEAKEKQTSLMRSGAKRLMHIAKLEKELEGERSKGKRMVDELVKQTKMMDLVINFRDQECARDVNELTHQNTELAEKLDLWKDRAQMLQQERWGFVQKFRAAQAQAGVGGSAAFDAMNAANVDDEPDDEDEGSADADDW